MEYGLFLTGSGAPDRDIEAGLAPLVEREDDPDQRLLKRMQKEAVFCLIRGDSAGTVKLVMESLLNTWRPRTAKFDEDRTARYYRFCLRVMRILAKLLPIDHPLYRVYDDLVDSLAADTDEVFKPVINNPAQAVGVCCSLKVV